MTKPDWCKVLKKKNRLQKKVRCWVDLCTKLAVDKGIYGLLVRNTTNGGTAETIFIADLILLNYIRFIELRYGKFSLKNR